MSLAFQYLSAKDYELVCMSHNSVVRLIANHGVGGHGVENEFREVDLLCGHQASCCSEQHDEQSHPPCCKSLK